MFADIRRFHAQMGEHKGFYDVCMYFVWRENPENTENLLKKNVFVFFSYLSERELIL